MSIEYRCGRKAPRSKSSSALIITGQATEERTGEISDGKTITLLKIFRADIEQNLETVEELIGHGSDRFGEDKLTYIKHCLRLIGHSHRYTITKEVPVRFNQRVTMMGIHFQGV